MPWSYQQVDRMETVDRIQLEIQEALRREEEYREKYKIGQQNGETNGLNGHSSPSPEPRTNGTGMEPPRSNGTVLQPRSTSLIEPPRNGTGPAPKLNHRIFVQHPNSGKGLMQKFIKMRGKITVSGMAPVVEPERAWVPPDFVPAKVKLEPGKDIRNGFVSAEEKMKRELLDFQKREEELRNERKKSQPDLMAALQREQESGLAAKSGVMYSNEDITDSRPPPLRRARSLAELLDSDGELEAPGTHSLIRQFENLNQS